MLYYLKNKLSPMFYIGKKMYICKNNTIDEIRTGKNST